MTLRDKVEEVEPQYIDSSSLGGVKGCPVYYDYLPYNSDPCDGDEHRADKALCEACWSRPWYPLDRDIVIRLNDAMTLTVHVTWEMAKDMTACRDKGEAGIDRTCAGCAFDGLYVDSGSAMVIDPCDIDEVREACFEMVREAER